MENFNYKGNIIYVNQSIYNSNDWHSVLHSHPFTEILYVISGSGQFVVREKQIEIKEDDMIIVNPNILHTEKSKKNMPLDYIVIGLDGIKFDSDNDSYIIHNYSEYKHNILLYVKALLVEHKEKNNFFDDLSVKLIEILLLNILRYTNDTINFTPLQKNSNAKNECILIENYIDKHFKENLTLDSICQVTHLNKFYVSHIFKDYKKMSIMAYVNERRIKEAKMLLETSNLSIGAISSITGFSSQSYFTQSFKNSTNLSPLKYRSLHKL